MTKLEETLMAVVYDRKEVACRRLESNRQYMDAYTRQQESDAHVEEIYRKRLSEDEIKIIRSHYEGESEVTCMESEEIYLQGVRDGVQLLIKLGVLSN